MDNKMIIKSMLKKQEYATKKTSKTSRKRCPKGQVLRTAYVRDAYTNKNGVKIQKSIVPATCIEDVGKPGKGLYNDKGERIYIHIKRGELGQFGYHGINKLTEKQRRIRLGRAVRQLSKGNYLPIYRKLILFSTLFKNKKPDDARLYREDAEWVKKYFKKN